MGTKPTDTTTMANENGFAPDIDDNVSDLSDDDPLDSVHNDDDNHVADRIMNESKDDYRNNSNIIDNNDNNDDDDDDELASVDRLLQLGASSHGDGDGGDGIVDNDDLEEEEEEDNYDLFEEEEGDRAMIETNQE